MKTKQQYVDRTIILPKQTTPRPHYYFKEPRSLTIMSQVNKVMFVYINMVYAFTQSIHGVIVCRYHSLL